TRRAYTATLIRRIAMSSDDCSAYASLLRDLEAQAEGKAPADPLALKILADLLEERGGRWGASLRELAAMRCVLQRGRADIRHTVGACEWCAITRDGFCIDVRAYRGTTEARALRKSWGGLDRFRLLNLKRDGKAPAAAAVRAAFGQA